MRSSHTLSTWSAEQWILCEGWWRTRGACAVSTHYPVAHQWSARICRPKYRQDSQVLILFTYKFVFLILLLFSSFRFTCAPPVPVAFFLQKTDVCFFSFFIISLSHILLFQTLLLFFLFICLSILTFCYQSLRRKETSKYFHQLHKKTFRHM